MTRTLRALLLAGLALSAIATAACQTLSSGGDGGRHAGPPPSRLSTILSRGELRVGLTGDQPPLNMTDRAGEVIGLEVDLVRTLGESMGLDARFLKMPFADLLPALERGEVDLVISGMTITPERNARVAFVGPYFISGKSLLAKSKTIASAEDPGTLDDPARTYVALAGSTSETFVKQAFPQAKLVTAASYDDAVQQVIDDRVDALVADFPFCSLTAHRYPEAGLATVSTPFTIEPLGIALPPDDPLFVNLMDNYLKTLRNTGILTQLHARWFSAGDWVQELP